jgi:hypothetical protein
MPEDVSPSAILAATLSVEPVCEKVQIRIFTGFILKSWYGLIKKNSISSTFGN